MLPIWRRYFISSHRDTCSLLCLCTLFFFLWFSDQVCALQFVFILPAFMFNWSVSLFVIQFLMNVQAFLCQYFIFITLWFLTYYCFFQYVFLPFSTGIFFFKCEVVFIYLPCIINVNHFSWYCLCSKAVQIYIVCFLFFYSTIYGLSFYTPFCILHLSRTHCFCSLLCGRVFGVLLDTLWFCRYIGCCYLFLVFFAFYRFPFSCLKLCCVFHIHSWFVFYLFISLISSCSLSSFFGQSCSFRSALLQRR